MRAQLLDGRRPTDLVGVVRKLTLVQIDPTAAVAPNADLVLWSRLGGAHSPQDLKRALEQDRTLFELDALIRPMDDLPLFLAAMTTFPVRERTRNWMTANGRFRNDILARLRDSGPLRSRDIPDTSTVSWASTGWTNKRNVTQMLEILVLQGAVAISRREGRERFFDVAERVYPGGVQALPRHEALRARGERRLRSLGIARRQAPEQPIEPLHVGAAGEEAVVEGVPGAWRVDPEAIGGSLEPRTALLSPFDRLVYDRARARELFGFEYVLEMYKPAAKRRWGFFALPILAGNRLVGKLDATADRKRGVLTVNAVHHDVPFSTAVRDEVDHEIDELAGWLGLTR